MKIIMIIELYVMEIMIIQLDVMKIIIVIQENNNGNSISN